MARKSPSPAGSDTRINHKTGVGVVYLVATPIGNLSDISERGCRALIDADFIAAEDTRVTRKLLAYLNIKKPLVCYRAQNAPEAGCEITARVLAGERCALVTDAGTPGISDPGEDLVRLCIASGIPVEVIPGPCAAIAALTVSGLPAGRFAFEGFLPANKSKRLSRLRLLSGEQRTMIFYEAPHKLLRTLKDMCDVFGSGRRVSVSREMTKIFEETLRLTLSEAAAHFEQQPARGEFVLVVEGSRDASSSGTGQTALEEAVESALSLISGGMSVRDAVDKAACEAGCSGNKLYKAVITAMR